MKFILGKKIGMSQVFDEKGVVVPITVVEAGPCFITQIRDSKKDGYSAVQICYGEKKLKNSSLALRGHLAKAGRKSARFLREFEFGEDDKLQIGDEINVSIFGEGDKINVSGFSKGKGFQGVVKRHKFAGAPASHGHYHVLRMGGSVGCRFPQHTRKGRRMPGHTGVGKITVKNLTVVKIDKGNNLIAIGGAVPGHTGSLLKISSIK